MRALPGLRDRLLSGPSLGERFAQCGERTSGFDYLRLILAVVILLIHTGKQIPQLAVSPYGAGKIATVLIAFLVPVFFALGGFLVAASAERNSSLRTFLGLRILRIFPALWVDILFAALILGPLVTTLPVRDYFADTVFRRYFLNLIGEIQYTLPGVFETNPKHDVNGQLWTEPYELGGYFILSLAIAGGLYARRRLYLLAILGLICAITLAFRLAGWPDYYEAQAAVIPCFLMAAAVYLHRDVIPYNVWLFGLCFVAAFVLYGLRAYTLACVPVAYVTVYCGLANPRRLGPVRWGDYSYGIYLYHRQIQQTFWATTAVGRTMVGGVILPLLVSAVAAAISWHLVEKPTLSMRRFLRARGTPRFALNQDREDG